MRQELVCLHSAALLLLCLQRSRFNTLMQMAYIHRLKPAPVGLVKPPSTPAAISISDLKLHLRT
jgi:hypothetical protein